MCRDEQHRNGLWSSEGYRTCVLGSRRALARVRQLQNSYDLHERQCDRGIPAPKRKGYPMPIAEGGEVLLTLHVSQSIWASSCLVEQEV